MKPEPDFSEGFMALNSPCEKIGHDEEHAFYGYDFAGTLAKICPRGFCYEVIDTIHVDDLSRDKYDELMKLIRDMTAEHPFDGE